MRALLAGLTIATGSSIVLAQHAEIEGLRQGFTQCHAMTDPMRRVACYDALLTKIEPPRFQGSLAEETAPFEIDRPTMLRYQSDGPVFVMYLKDKAGAVVQNLHIGGGGEDSYLITRPGTYSLQVSGTDTWRIWVDPVAGAHG